MYVILRTDLDSEPILATRDARVVDAVLRVVTEIIQTRDATTARAGGGRRGGGGTPDAAGTASTT